jgi:general secretion pathway protein E
MLVGEIRDLETARIAAQASLTGHLLLSTVHTNDAVGTITRLVDMGLEDYLVAAVLKGVVAQRLVRCLCPVCRERRDGMWHSVGCEACAGIGYRGRTTIAELLVFDEAFARLVIQRAGTEELRAAALAGGMIELHDDGLAKAEAGITSRDEVMRVTGAA